MKHLTGLAVAAVLTASTIAVEAAPATYDFTATVDVVVNTPGVSVGQTVTGSFTYDPANFSIATTSFAASVGTFSLTEQFSWILINGTPDEQFLEGTGSNTTQFGFYFRDSAGAALDGTAIADVSLDLDDWTTESIRWNVFDPQTLKLVQGWNGTITSIVPATTTITVPEPATLALVAGALLGLGISRRRRRAD